MRPPPPLREAARRGLPDHAQSGGHPDLESILTYQVGVTPAPGMVREASLRSLPQRGWWSVDY